MPVTEGQLQHERFVLEEHVGGGASGDIYAAKDLHNGQRVAVKLLRSTATASDLSRFEREMRVLAELRHPNVVAYIDGGLWPDGRMFFAMEWLEGEDLAKRSRRAPLGTRDAVEVVRRSAQALAAGHSRGIVHRDLKLSNMYLVKGRGTAIKLIDFGVVKPAEKDGFETEPGTIIGTPHYMSPEQARGEQVDVRADVYSLGSVLFRLLTGRHVFETNHVVALLGRLVLEDPPRPRTFRFDVPAALDEVVFRAISRDREQRYANAGDFARALARVGIGTLNNEPPRTERSSSRVRPRPPKRKKETTGTGTGTTGNRPTHPGIHIRRVVACLVYDAKSVNGRAPHETVIELAGEDVRLEQIAGGNTVAVFGVEHSRGDEILRAARAALHLVAEFPGARAAVANGHAIKARANLAGEALDRAAKQFEMATAGNVRLDIHAAGALEVRFEVARDKHGAVLVGEDARDLAPRTVLGRPTATVGRERELTSLQVLYNDALRDAMPRAAIVSGRSGIGKSRVRSELIQRLELAQVPPEVLICWGSHHGSISALGRALRSRIGVQAGADAPFQVEQVRRFFKERMPRNLHFLSAFIGELVGVPFDDRNHEQLRAARGNDQLMQSRIWMALEAFVRTQCGRIPQVIVLEDAHFIDDTTLQLLDWLLGCNDIRFIVYAFAGADLVNRKPGLWQTDAEAVKSSSSPRPQPIKINLGPLAETASQHIVASVLPDMSSEQRQELVQRSEGIPLVLEELIRCTAEGVASLPLTVQALVQQRVDRLPDSVYEVLCAASVFGSSFWQGGVSAMLDRPIEDDLEEAAGDEILLRRASSSVAGETEWSFRQLLVCEVAYSLLLDNVRQELHIAAGNWLEATGSVDLGWIAHHVHYGGEHERAAMLYARATRQAVENFGQMATALELANRGLSCGAQGPVRAQLLLTQAHVYQRTGWLSKGCAAAEQAGQLVPPGSVLWVTAQRVHAGCLIESGRAAEGDQLLAWALEDDNRKQLADSDIAMLLAARVRALVGLNRVGQALGIAEEAVATASAPATSNQPAFLRALDAMLFAQMVTGRPAHALATGMQLMRAADAAGDGHLGSRARINAASSLNYLGRFEEAQRYIEEALPLVHSARLRLLEASAIHNLGVCYARLGQLDRGIEAQRTASRMADERGSARQSINARMYEVQMLCWRNRGDDIDVALKIAERIVAEARQRPHLQPPTLYVLAHVHLMRRDPAAALPLAREAHLRLGDGPVEEWEEMIRLCHIHALLMSNEQSEADKALRAAFESLRCRCESIADDDLRQCFQQRNFHAAQLIELASQRLQLQIDS